MTDQNTKVQGLQGLKMHFDLQGKEPDDFQRQEDKDDPDEGRGSFDLSSVKENKPSSFPSVGSSLLLLLSGSEGASHVLQHVPIIGGSGTEYDGMADLVTDDFISYHFERPDIRSTKPCMEHTLQDRVVIHVHKINLILNYANFPGDM
ncbi:hypothetical protein D9C73_018493 [Collichthys lucidus]|uniref:Uncharacterized protein n=1 Tax=Collichthys lucidus TaxID=240159 RepID=A0A4U5VAB5_COLLU|nr:hypothetical protein D9C73_018493 [Collichthys lucidus]